MSRKNTSKASGTDWHRIDDMQDEDIDLSDIPEITEEQMARAKLRIGGKPVHKGEKVSIRVDAEIVAYFKLKAGEVNYESAINDMLKAGIRGDCEVEVAP